MNCICDQFQFPLETKISPGLSRLPRQTGKFAEFRRALLRAISLRTTAHLENHPLWSQRFLTERDRDGLRLSLAAIGMWRGRHPEDFGMMLLEMWAYVCDLTSFYDEVLADESYVRTSIRRDSLRLLVDPLGYIARPAVAALADLAVFADGRQVVTLPVGTAFRSGAFNGHPPQVFELTKPAAIHPFLNQWTFQPVKPEFLPVTSTDQTFLLCRPGTVSARVDDLVVVRLGAAAQARRVTSVTDYKGVDGDRYIRVSFDTSLIVGPNTAYNSVRLLKPSGIAAQWKLTVAGEIPIGSDFIYLDSINRQIRSGQLLVLEGGGVLLVSTVDRNDDATRTITPERTLTFTPTSGPATDVTVPAVTAPVSLVSLTENINSTVAGASPQINVHFGLVDAGVVTAEGLTEIDQHDSLDVPTPIELPRDASAPGNFQLEDKNNNGLERPGSLNFANGEFSVQGDPFPNKLAPPVTLLGNVISTSRGEAVKAEVMGAGDAAIANQSFTLKKSPLTYLPAPSENTPSGLTSTLKVYVDGLQWTEVPAFFGHSATDEIYVVRENDKHESVVTFGDGFLGRRLSTGASVVAYYRQGAGAATPPAGSITQIAKPFKGLTSVRNPVAAFGGADAEPADSLRKFAPRSALLLGRAVSLADLEAAAASYSGVRAVAAEWRWSTTLQVPAAHIFYLADGDITELLLNKLRSLTQPDIPIQVERAAATPANLCIQIVWDPKRFEVDVLDAVRSALIDVETGLLPPERLGIGKPLFRSLLFEFVLSVTGVVAVTGLLFQSLDFSDFGSRPAAGHYFDFTNQLFLNGRTS